MSYQIFLTKIDKIAVLNLTTGVPLYPCLLEVVEPYGYKSNSTKLWNKVHKRRMDFRGFLPFSRGLLARNTLYVLTLLPPTPRKKACLY